MCPNSTYNFKGSWSDHIVVWLFTCLFPTRPGIGKLQSKIKSSLPLFVLFCFFKNKVLLEYHHAQSPTRWPWLLLPYSRGIVTETTRPPNLRYLLSGPLRKELSTPAMDCKPRENRVILSAPSVSQPLAEKLVHTRHEINVV